MSYTDESTSATGNDPASWFSRLRNKNPFQSSYWGLYSIIDDAHSRLLLALGLVTAIAAGIPLPLIAVTFKGIVESFPPDERSLDRAVFQIVGISFAYFIVTFAWSVAWGELGRRISQKLQNKLVKKVLGLDQAFFDIDAVDITSVLVSDTSTIQRGTSEKVGLFIQSCSYFVATFITGFILNAALTGVLFAAIVPTIILITWTGSSLISKYSIKAAELTEKAAAVAEGAISCVLVVQAFSVVDVLSDKHAQLLRSATRYAIKKVVVSALMLATVFWACYSLNALAFYWGSRIGGSSGTIYAVVFLVLDASFVFNQVGPFIQTIALAAGASSKVFSLLDRKDSGIHIYSNDGIQLNYYDVGRDIHFNGVEFAYPVRPTVKVLNSLSLTIPGGQSTAIVGLSGSGKSTLAGLLLRLYDPNAGSIMIGDHNSQDVHLATFRSHIAVVQQNPVIFSGTILDNIKCGIVNVADLKEEDVRVRCLQAANDAHCDFIDGLPEGIHTFVSSSQGLSGGQRQRICLARALVRKPALLILDEPTSALDSWSEQKIEESLKKVIDTTDTTIITIAHRLTTIKDYSNIVVMGDGQVLEQGSHEELLQNGVHYKALVEAQQLEQAIEEDPGFSDSSLESTPVLTSAETSLEKIVTQRSHHSHHSTKKERSQQVKATSELEMSNGHMLKRCFQYLKPERGLLFAGVAAATVQGCVVIGEAIVFGHLISILNTTTDVSLLYSRVDFYSLMFFVISLVAFSAAAINGVCFGFVSEAFVLRMRDVLLRTILAQDQSWFQEPDHTTTKLMAGINQNANSLGAVSGPILQTLFATTAMIVSGMILALISTPLVTVVVLSYVPAILLSGYVRVKMLSLFDHRYAQANKSAAAIACEAVQNIQTVAAYGLEEELHRKYGVALRASYWSNFVVMAVGDLALSFSYSVIYFLYPLLYWWGSRQVRDGRYTQEAFFVTLPAIVIASQQCGQFFTMAPEITSARSAAREVFHLLKSKPTISDNKASDQNISLEKMMDAIEPIVPLSLKAESDEPQHLSDDSDTTLVGTGVLQKKQGGVEVKFKDVAFTYPTRPDKRILQGINLRIQPGQFVAFVGPSGAGKSSLVALLERFFDPSHGKVLVNGEDIRSVPVSTHRSQLGLVPQEPELFAGSVSFNISLGAVPGTVVSQEEIEAVCRSCGIHDFIASLPEGYDTECGSNGSKLSGGQKQRIAVARALIRDPRILLLDEATASLDSHSEKDIQQAVDAASNNRTTIVVAHRLSTIQHADCIFVLDNGILVDQGTHTELIKKEGIYSSMVQAQALG